jgi:integrase/recombinase XerD
MHKTDLGTLVETFFCKRLIFQCRASPHTIASYRDTFRLLLAFAQKRLNRPPSQLELKDISPSLVSDFLDHLEATRGNRARTRNLRLTAVRSFFRFAALEAPDHGGAIQRVLAIPNKRCQRPLIGFLTRPEIEALLAAVDGRTWIDATTRSCWSRCKPACAYQRLPLSVVKTSSLVPAPTFTALAKGARNAAHP